VIRQLKRILDEDMHYQEPDDMAYWRYVGQVYARLDVLEKRYEGVDVGD
jgi:hypothetical protein